MGFCYWRALGLVPDVLSPFLQEIWVATGLFHNQRQRVLPNFDALGFRGAGDNLEQVRQVGFQVAAIRQTRFKRKIEAKLDVLQLDFERVGESSQRTECPPRQILGPRPRGEPEQGDAQLRNELGRQ